MSQLVRHTSFLLSRLNKSFSVGQPISAIRTFSNNKDQNSNNVSDRHAEFVQKMEKLYPTDQFVASLDSNTHKKIDLLKKEIEIFAYMGRFVPTHLTNDDWITLLEMNTVHERVTFLEFVAVKIQREMRDQSSQTKREDDYLAHMEDQKERFGRGEMGYGPEMIQLLSNPFRNQKRLNHIRGSRILAATRHEMPQFAFDLQYMFQSGRRNQFEMSKQMQYCISENLTSRTPFPLSFFNFPKTDDAQKWLEKSVGFYSGQYTSQTILPTFHNGPLNKVYKKDHKIVYISKNAQEVLDGPLTPDVYVMCATMDLQRESLGAARRARVKAVRLPIQKYISWQSGPMVIPFPNILRIFRHVYTTGGDWETALKNNIAKRHLMSPEEREAQGKQVTRRKERIQEKLDLIKMICDGTGQTYTYRD